MPLATPQAFDSSVGGAQSNSYVSVAEAESLLQALPVSPGITDWLALTTTEKQQTLVGGTLVLDSLNWIGHVCSEDQRLQWPRLFRYEHRYSKTDTIPTDIHLATAYMAAFMGPNGGFIGVSSAGSIGGGVAALEPFDEVELGPIKVKMKEGVTYGDEMTTSIGQIPPFVADLIRRYLDAFGATQGWMTRRSVATAWGGYIGSPSYSGTMYLRGGMVYPRLGGWASNGMGRYRYR